VQVMFIANLIALTLVIAPLLHLARLVHAFEGAKDVEIIFKQLRSSFTS